MIIRARKSVRLNLTKTLREMDVGTYIRVSPNEISKYGIKHARHVLFQEGMRFKQRIGAGGYTVITKIPFGHDA